METYKMKRFESLYHAMKKPLAVILVTVLLIASFLYLDKPIARVAHQLLFAEKSSILLWITNMGTGIVYMVLFLLLALFFRYITPKKEWELRMWFLWLCALIPNILCFVLKVTLGRARPDLLFSKDLYGFYGYHKSVEYWSFPSGHTTTIMGIAFGLSILFPRYFYPLIFAGLCIATSRIILLKHYLSDVLAASYFALITIGLMYTWLRSKHYKLSCIPYGN